MTLETASSNGSSETVVSQLTPDDLYRLRRAAATAQRARLKAEIAQQSVDALTRTGDGAVDPFTGQQQAATNVVSLHLFLQRIPQLNIVVQRDKPVQSGNNNLVHDDEDAVEARIVSRSLLCWSKVAGSVF